MGGLSPTFWLILKFSLLSSEWLQIKPKASLCHTKPQHVLYIYIWNESNKKWATDPSFLTTKNNYIDAFERKNNSILNNFYKHPFRTVKAIWS